MAGGLGRFYELRQGPGQPVGELALERRDHSWLLPLEGQLASGGGPHALHLQLQGIRCAACVWLVEQLFERVGGGGQVVVNPGTGDLALTVGGDFPLRGFVQDVEAVGYLVGPHSGRSAPERDDLLMRAGVCSALALNTMMFSAAIYLGLREGALYDFLRSLNFGLAALAVLIGGPVFIGSAVQALKRRVVHLDVPIALAILLTFAAAVWSFVTGNQRAAYHDSLAVFVALMLVGRYLQERVLRQNRDQMLADDGVDGLRVQLLKRSDSGVHALPKPRWVAAREVVAGDLLLVAPGDLVPVPAELCSERASCSLDWINGESAPATFERGATLPAGAFNIGVSAVELRAELDFADSSLRGLLRAPRRVSTAAGGSFVRFAPGYVLGVLASALGGFAYWTWQSGDPVRGLEVATAVLVVTCPCAIGIATPLAYELAHAGLRRMGLFVRRGDYLDRARGVRRVAFDKTGTLTTGRLQLDDPAALLALPVADRAALYNMVVRSLHPQSLAVRAALLEDGVGAGVGYDRSLEVTERAGCGLSMRSGHHCYRLGSSAWLGHAASSALCFERDREVLLAIGSHEALRHDARAEVARLDRMGVQSWILSGDAPARVAHMARGVGIDPERARGGLSPEDKAAWIRAHDRDDTLMLGDGINDSLAVQQAHCAGTPSIDRSFMPARSDFYFVTPGLAPISHSLRVARALARTVRSNVAVAIAYNVGAVLVALSGHMDPWVAALLMPLSSLGVVGLTLASLSQRSLLWKP